MTQELARDQVPLPGEEPPDGAPFPASRWTLVPKALVRFLPHSWNELLTIAIAVISLVISLNTSQKQAARDQRQQLTDTLDRYLQIQAQQIDVFQQIQSNPNNLQMREFSRQVYNTFDLQNTALLAQAADLAREIPDEVGWADYATMAAGFASTGDLATAERYYRLAIDSAAGASDYATGRARNMYAAFLFTQPSRVEDGRHEYEAIQQLVEQMAVDEELKRYYSVNQYLFWARSEANIGNLNEADAVLKDACEVAKNATLALSRGNLIASVNETWLLIHQYPIPTTGPAAAALLCQ